MTEETKEQRDEERITRAKRSNDEPGGTIPDESSDDETTLKWANSREKSDFRLKVVNRTTVFNPNSKWRSIQLNHPIPQSKT